MKILVCANEFKNFYLFRSELIHSLETDYELCLVAKYDGYEKYFDHYTIFDIDFQSNSIKPIKELLSILNLKKLIKEINPDYILTFTIKPNIYVGVISLFLKKFRFVPNITGLGTMFLKNRFLSTSFLLLYKISLLRSTKVFFQNSEDHKYFLNKNIIKADKSEIIPGSGINMNKFQIKQKVNPVKKIIFVGRLIKDKGLIEFIEASNRILKQKAYKVQFFIAGKYDALNPRSIPKIILDSWEKNKECNYLGEVDGIGYTLKEYDIFVLPSYREGLSKALLEACGNGLPIITTSVPGCKELVKNYNGIAITPRNVLSLEKAIVEILNMPNSELLQMGRKSYELVSSKYSIEKVIMQYKKIL